MSDYAERAARNDRSRNTAEHHSEEWSVDEIDFLMLEFDKALGNRDDEEVVAECLGRTIEACRQRFYEVRSGKRGRSITVKSTTTTHVVEYRGQFDDPDDQWWSPDFYKGK